VPGTLVFDVSDPSGDDNGPGNYAYPTSSNFTPAPSTSATSRSGTRAPTSRSDRRLPGAACSRCRASGQRYEDASGNTVGTIAIGANQISRYITFKVSKASLGGTPASGWALTVVLHGQDGFSSDQARGFAPTPQDFLFGVCATASSDAHCTANPNSVPKAIDVLAPSGVAQADELDYTLHNPVVLQG
jgi:glucoamylase